MNYFFIGFYIDQLVESDYIYLYENQCILSQKGMDTLDFLHYKLPRYIREKVDSLVKKEQSNLKRQINVRADYQLGMKKDFNAILQINDNKHPLMELTFSCGSKKEAMKVCENFKNHANDIYHHITMLLVDPKNAIK